MTLDKYNVQIRITTSPFFRSILSLRPPFLLDTRQERAMFFFRRGLSLLPLVDFRQKKEGEYLELYGYGVKYFQFFKW